MVGSLLCKNHRASFEEKKTHPATLTFEKILLFVHVNNFCWILSEAQLRVIEARIKTETLERKLVLHSVWNFLSVFFLAHLFKVLNKHPCEGVVLL